MNVMKNYKEKLESLIEDLNVLCLDHTLTQEKKNPGKFKLVEKKFPNYEPTIKEKLRFKEIIKLIIFYEEDCSDCLDGKDRHIMIQHEMEYFQSDREEVEDYMYRGLYYEFLKYTLFAKEFNSKDSDSIGIRIIPVRDLIVYGLNKE